MTRQLRPSPNCLNCGHAVAARFCSECGQENTSYRVSLGRLLGDLFEELFQLESRLWRTLWTLVRRPGRLTRDYNAGRRVSYTTPLRLYLTTSVVYFFVAAVLPPKMKDNSEIKLEVAQKGVDIDHLPPPKSWLDARVRERLGILHKLDPKEASRRVRMVLISNTPKVMALLVPLFALLLMLFFRRRFYVEHLVMALHAHSFAFLSGTLAELTRSGRIENLTLLAACGWTYVAMHTVYEQSWLRTAWKALLIFVVYTIFVGIGVSAAMIGGLLVG
jgi:hypothetical protein